MSNFKQLGLKNEILQAVLELGFENPTPIQEQAIPALLAEDIDLIGLAQTGTGKTAAFGLPLVQKINVDERRTQALVLAPTRELALQIVDQISKYSKYINGLTIAAVYGGASIMTQLDQVRRKPHIIVATPGRLIDLVNRKAADLSGLEYIVLDEADEMFNMGFKEDVDEILSKVTGKRNIWLFTATMAKPVRKVISDYMDNPLEVKVSTGNSVNKNISHKYILVDRKFKLEALARLLDMENDMRVIVFCRTKAETQDTSEALMKLGYKVAPIHGDMTQQQRERVMKQFKDHSLELLIATDVAARGIDVDNVTHVIHHSLPDESAYYSHRSGRTARAGKDGITIAMISKREERRIRELERELSISFEHIKIPTVDEIKEMRISKWLEEFVNEEWKPNVESFLVQARELLMQLNKEEIIDKLLNKEFASLLQTKNTQDLNEPQGRDKKERGDRSDRGGRRERTGGRLDTSSYERRSREGSLPFFINLGGNDGLKKGELLKLVCDTTNLKSKDITRLKILDKHSFFDVIEDRSSRVASSFKNVKYQGREVKVNRDFPKGE